MSDGQTAAVRAHQIEMAINQGLGSAGNFNSIAMNGGMVGMAMNSHNPNHFFFTGNAISLKTRLGSMTDQQINSLMDASITVTGAEIHPMNNCGYFCTIVWGSLLILPLFCMCCDWWRKCVYPGYEIPLHIYQSLGRLISGTSLRNITLNVVDNKFDAEKADTVYKMVSRSQIHGFTFINQAGNWDYDNNQNSNFPEHMKPIKQLQNISSDLRWGTQIAK